MNVECNRLDRQFLRYQDEYEAAALKALRSGWYILGREVEAFEREFAGFCEIPYCVGVNSGLDALTLAFRALGVGAGDEVIVPANTYIASVLAITANRAIPVLVEPDCFYNLDPTQIEKNITARTKAILAVHLYGQACRMDNIIKIANAHNLYLVEDCAQSHGVDCAGRITGTFGAVGCFSFFPTKNLGGFGDGGAIVTASQDLAEKIRMLRNYGSRVKYYNELEGVNSRLDELQAALLRVKLKHLMELNRERICLAQRYLTELRHPAIHLPKTAPGCGHGYHLFVIRTKRREGLAAYLQSNGIKTMIHYPIPPHRSTCYEGQPWTQAELPITEEFAATLLTLPLYNGMTEAEQSYVIKIINTWEDSF